MVFFFFQTFLHYWFTQITQNYLNIYLLNDSQKKISYTLSIKFDVLIKLSIQSTHSQIILNIYICIGTKLLMVRGLPTSVTYSTYKLHGYLQTYSYIVWTLFHELGYPIESASLRPTYRSEWFQVAQFMFNMLYLQNSSRSARVIALQNFT